MNDWEKYNTAYRKAPKKIQLILESEGPAVLVSSFIKENNIEQTLQPKLLIVVSGFILGIIDESEAENSLLEHLSDKASSTSLVAKVKDFINSTDTSNLKPLIEAGETDTSLTSKTEDDDEEEVISPETIVNPVETTETTPAPVIKQDLWSQYLEATDATTKEMLFTQVTNQAKRGAETDVSASWKLIHASVENNSWYQGNALPAIKNTYTEAETDVPNIIAGIQGSATGESTEGTAALQHTIVQYNSLPEPIQQMIYYGSIAETVTHIATACNAISHVKKIENEVVLILLLLSPREGLDNILTTKYQLSAEDATTATYLIDTTILIPVFNQLSTTPITAPEAIAVPTISDELPQVRTMEGDKAMHGYQTPDETVHSAVSQDDLVNPK